MLLGRVEVASQPTAVVDDQVRLDAAGHRKELLGVPEFHDAGVMSAEIVEPEPVYLPVVRQQFADLAVQVLDISLVVLAEVVGMMPVRLGVIDYQFQVVLVAGVGDLLHDVDLPRRCRPGGLEVRQLRVVQAESVMMLDQEDQVLLPGVFGDFDPLLGVELLGVPLGI